jgi:hypothetical protein
MNFKDQLEYWKAYLRTMPKVKFNYIISIITTLTTLILALTSVKILIGIYILSLILSTYMYFFKGEQ